MQSDPDCVGVYEDRFPVWIGRAIALGELLGHGRNGVVQDGENLLITLPEVPEGLRAPHV